MPTLRESRQKLKWHEEIIRSRSRGYKNSDDKYISNKGLDTLIRNFYLDDPSVGDTTDMNAEEIEEYRARRRRQGIRL